MEGLGTEPTMKSTQLYKEFQKFVNTSLDIPRIIETIDQALKMLNASKDSEHRPSLGAFPDEFRCPISKEFMIDPVVLCSGQTYDRSSIDKWLKEGHNTCPITKQVYTGTDLIPNNSVREFISRWCKEHGKELLDSVQYSEEEPKEVVGEIFSLSGPKEAAKQHGVREAADARDRLNLLLEKMISPSAKKEAVREIRMLTRDVSSVHALFAESEGTLPKLFNAVLEGTLDIDVGQNIQQNLVKILMDISTLDNNKKLFVDNPMAIQLLVKSLYSENIETRCSAAKALFNFSNFESNKRIIGNSGASNPLIDLIEKGHSTMKYVVSVVLSLSTLVIENRGRAVEDGAVGEIDEVLTMLSSLEPSQENIFDLNVVHLLLVILTKEHVIATLCTLLTPAKKIEFECKTEELWAILTKLSSLELAQKEIFDLNALHLLLVILTKEHVHAMQNGTLGAKKKARNFFPEFTAVTCNCSSMEKWLKEGNNTFLTTKQELLEPVQDSKVELKEAVGKISSSVSGLKEAAKQHGEKETAEARDRLNSLLGEMSSPSTQKEAARDIMILTRDVPLVQALFGESKDTLPKLLNPVFQGKLYTDVDLAHDLQQNLVKVLMYISTLHNNKKILVENPVAIQLLVKSLSSEIKETRCSAVKALSNFSTLESNKRIIGKSGAIKSLIDLIEEGHSSMKDAVSAVHSLCTHVIENRGKAIDAGAVRVILKKIEFEVEIEELLAILAMLSSLESAQKEIFDPNVVHLLLAILTEDTTEGCKENVLAILYTICSCDKTRKGDIGKQEATISKFVQSGTLRAKKKASDILSLLQTR